MQTLGAHYLDSAIKRVEYYKIIAEKALSQLVEKDFFYTPDANANSIAVIIQHMSGNMLSRWTNFLTEDGEKEWRNRDTEFNDQQFSQAAIMALWQEGWDCFLDTLKNLRDEDLLKTIYIRKEPLLVIDAINRQLAHYPHHVGQIIYIAKMLVGDRWQSLSIEKGKSDDFNAMMAAQRTL